MWKDELIRAKEAKKLTNKEIAELSGIPEGTIGRIMCGAADDIKLQTAIQLAVVLDISLDDLAGIKSGGDKTSIDQFERLAYQMISRQNREKRILFVCLMALVAIVIFLFIYDICTPGMGYFRRALEAIQQSVSTGAMM